MYIRSYIIKLTTCILYNVSDIKIPQIHIIVILGNITV